MISSSLLNDEQFAALVSVGHDVLRAFPRKAGACVMIGALYVGRLHHFSHASPSALKPHSPRIVSIRGALIVA
jgi:hypothetical protein